MDKDKVYFSRDIIQRIVNELREVESLTPDGTLKFKINNVVEILSKVSNCDAEESIEDIIYNKMRDAMSKNPELHVKLYMLYRNLNDGKITEEEARERYETYLQIYPYDTMIY